jgi:hypothetical protein
MPTILAHPTRVLPSVVAGALLWYAGGRPREDC